MALDPTQRAATPPKPTPVVPPGVQQSPPVVEQVNQVSQAALSAYPDGVIHRWDNLFIANTGTYSWNVLLNKEGNNLKYQLENRQTKESQIRLVSIDPRLQQQQFIKTLVEHCEPLLENESEVYFSSKLCEYDLHGQAEPQVIKVRLLRGPQQLFWQKWDPLFSTRTYVPVSLTLPSVNCSASTQATIRAIAQWNPVTTQRELLPKFRCVRLENEEIEKIKFPEDELDEKTISFKIGCKCQFDVFGDGQIKIIFYDHEKLPTKADFKDRSYSLKFFGTQSPHQNLVPYFVKDSKNTVGIFLTKAQAKEKHWKFTPPHFSYQLGPVTQNQTSCVLTPLRKSHHLPCQKVVSATLTVFVEVNRKHAIWQETGGRTHSSYLEATAHVLPPFHLSFPNDTALSFPLSKLTCVELEPLFISSFFDKTVPITSLRWGFTLIAYRGSQGNHAAGVIEAFNDGFFPEKEKNTHVKFHFHFTGDEIEYKYLEEIRFEERSKVHLISVENAKKIIDAVKEAKSKQPPRYDQRGIDAWGSKGHSCFTWLREVVKTSGIDLGTSLVGFLITRTKNWTEKEYPAQNELF